jgi:Tol biopolymer transport system component
MSVFALPHPRGTFAVLLVLLGAAGAVAGGLAREARGTSPGPKGKIAFTFTVDFVDWDVYAINPDGSGLTNLTAGTPDSRDDLPAWSPDGKRIAFSSDRTGSFHLYVMNADGSNPVMIPNTTGGRESDWSPDGKRILYQSQVSGVSQLYVVNADGSGTATQLTANTSSLPEDCCAFSWSANGNRIVFTSNRTQNLACSGSACLSINSMRDDGTDVRQLTADSLDAVNPDWASRGSDIVFNSRFFEPNGDIFVMHKNGTQLRQLTTSPGNDILPRWSPDRQMIVFAHADDAVEPAPFQLYTMNSDGSDNRQVISLNGWVFSPAWGRGGSALSRR